MELWHNFIIDIKKNSTQNKNAVVMFDCVFVYRILLRKGLENVIAKGMML